MSCQTMPAPAPVAISGDDRHHLTCCSPDTAMCGLNVADLPVTSGTGAVLCQLCAHAQDLGLPCTAPGCCWPATT